MEKEEKNGLIYFRHPLWDAQPLLFHGFFTRCGGISPPPYSSLNLGRLSGDRFTHIRENLQRAATPFSIPWDNIFCSAQVHGADIVQVSSSIVSRSVFQSNNPFRADALITDEKEIALGILTADCLPILFFDPGRPAVGAAHAGWRSTLQEISKKTLSKICNIYGGTPEDLLVTLGPAIGSCCYHVGEEVVNAFIAKDNTYEKFVQPIGRNQWRLDLKGINIYQLRAGGVKEKNIVSTPLCTRCHKDLFFSVRGSGEPTGRQISVVGLKQSDL